jgi:TetR/AcrR family transcriptional regulator, transcriptional repressor for nem operon
MGRVSDAKQRLMDAVLELIWQGSYGSTTIDQICEKSEVKKGSFYHFFESKSDLAAAALDADWEKQRVNLDAMFSPTVPPLERLKRFCDRGYQKQKDIKCQCGCVLGCPLFTLGSEVCTKEAKLHDKIKEILGHFHQYIESAIRDAHAAGEIDAPDAASKARMLFAYSEGLMTQARILNDVEVLCEMSEGMLAILGAKNRKAVA